MENKVLHHIDKPEIVNYIRSVGKEFAFAVKKSKKTNFDNALKDVLNCVNEPVAETHKTMLDYETNGNICTNIDKSRLKSVGNYKNIIDEKPEDDISKLFNPVKNLSIKKTFYDRKKEELIKKEKKLEIIKNKKRVEEEKNYKIKPKITKQSQKILDSKYSDKKPIYERTKDILNTRNKNLENLKSMYSELQILDEEESIGSFKPPGQYNPTRFLKWTKEREERDKKKHEKIDRIKQEMEYLETESFKQLYHPNIDKKSEKIVKSKIVNEEINENVYDKLYNLHSEKFNKINQLSQRTMPSFTPSINNRLPNFIQNSLSNKITKNDSMSNANQSTLKKLSSYSRHFLNSSVELKNSSILRNEKVFSNESLAAKYSRNKINSSMTEYYNNPLSTYKNEEEDNDIISRYKVALQSSNGKLSEIAKKSKFRVNNSYDNEREIKRHIPWQTSIHLVNNKIISKDEYPNSLYKINVRNNSAWDKNRENSIMYDNRFSNVLKSMSNTYNDVTIKK